MKPLIAILAIIGAVFLTLAAFADDDGPVERFGRALYVTIGAGLLTIDAVILIALTYNGG
jgi:peptidoglycan/LPS O-acetylase OafA/YrhL